MISSPRRVALITGGASGIGKAVALRLAEDGTAVAIVDIDLVSAMELEGEISSAAGTAMALEADVAEENSISDAVDRVVARFGRLDVLVNSAGIFLAGAIDDVTVSAWDRSMAVNVRGTYLASGAALSHLERSEGVIVNVASVAGLVGVRSASAYCASKGAVIALTRAMAIDLADRGVRVNAVCPGTVVTPMTEPLLELRGDGDIELGLERTLRMYPMGRLAAVQEIAEVIFFMAGHGSSYSTGSIVVADGGMTVA